MMKLIRNILKIIECRNIELSIRLPGVCGGGNNNNIINNNNNNNNIIIIIIISVILCRVFTIMYMKGACFQGI
jgi:hypothetical protein